MDDRLAVIYVCRMQGIYCEKGARDAKTQPGYFSIGQAPRAAPVAGAVGELMNMRSLCRLRHQMLEVDFQCSSMPGIAFTDADLHGCSPPVLQAATRTLLHLILFPVPLGFANCGPDRLWELECMIS